MGPAEQRGVSRRTVFRAGAVAATGAAAAGAGVGAQPASAWDHGHPSAGDLVLHDGTIHTMDGPHNVVRVVSIHDGRFVYVGDDLGRALKTMPDHARLVNLRGGTAIPGIIDNHNHVVLMGNRPGRHTPLENAYSIAEIGRASW